MKSESISTISSSPRKRKSVKRKRTGYRILNSIPHYRVDNANSKLKAVTRARDFISKEKITPSAVIEVTGKKKTDKFFWSRAGLYSLEHVAANYAGFPELNEHIRQYNELKSTK
ncbi:hypothetical protein NIES4071_102740 (plasmid) [Calothrix sp. NIES-4071]|nr:hypothetical protein NIES4071_102740 [Calothrix sp. NIES-4071]BAZ64655.1 hypothetical protein NIES4105_103880 [Calothrix sp. NIES-4105]